ncbi:hypothetical protein Hypma_012945 [Hypsizygus marmoreus]|uniref:Uncharacterized protein n=1 Tax=Hypsizygus marmoreus TaxID=39966 RepID=A0A369JFG6_HYPMA|nr:hypothetical protein Hypma_012945 [Hypsizygus marmoreus]
MAGHRRQDGFPVCPVRVKSSPSSSPSLSSRPSPERRVSPSPSFLSRPGSLMSPPPTPPRKNISNPHHNISAYNHLAREQVVIPESGPWHWRNPNWTGSPMLLSRAPSPVGSLISTVQVDDDGNTIRGNCDGETSEWENDDDDCATVVSTTSSFIDRVVETSKRVVSIVGTKRSDVTRVRQAAARHGVHAGLIQLPLKRSSGPGKEDSWLMVLGRSRKVVKHVVDTQQRSMPGVMGDLRAEGPRMTTFLQLVLAGFIGGCFAVYGLSFL